MCLMLFYSFINFFSYSFINFVLSIFNSSLKLLVMYGFIPMNFFKLVLIVYKPILKRRMFNVTLLQYSSCTVILHSHNSTFFILRLRLILHYTITFPHLISNHFFLKYFNILAQLSYFMVFHQDIFDSKQYFHL